MTIPTRIQIGVWVEKTERTITFCPSYYAADHKTVVTKVGESPLIITFEGGYNIPMPYWLLTGIPARCTGGAYYSGFAGRNFASSPIPENENDAYCVQARATDIPELVASGTIKLAPEWEWLGLEQTAVYAYMRKNGWTWERLRPFVLPYKD